jgi:hypothetical protein
MRFLGRHETSLLEKRLRQQIGEKPKPKAILYYESGIGSYTASTNAIVTSIGGFSETALLFLFCVSGDGWNEACVGNEQWRRYRQWRSEHGENRRLYDAPGHLFSSDEAKQLVEALDFSMQLGWDALVTAQPGRQLMLLSHDDRMEIHRGFEWRTLAAKLTSSGLWHY